MGKCRPQAIESAALISQVMPIEDVFRSLRSSIPLETSREQMTQERRTKSPKLLPLTPEQESIIEDIRGRYQKAERLARSVFRKGLDISGAISKGVNPYRVESSHKYMEVVCQMLIDEGCFSRKGIREAMMQRFGWSYGTANSHVLVCTHFLVAADICECDQHDRFQFKGDK